MFRSVKQLNVPSKSNRLLYTMSLIQIISKTILPLPENKFKVYIKKKAKLLQNLRSESVSVASL